METLLASIAARKAELDQLRNCAVGLPPNPNTNLLKDAPPPSRQYLVSAPSGNTAPLCFMRPPAGNDCPNVTVCRKPPGRRRETSATSNPLITTRNVKVRIAGGIILTLLR
jgi:hypothetical protein